MLTASRPNTARQASSHWGAPLFPSLYLQGSPGASEQEKKTLGYMDEPPPSQAHTKPRSLFTNFQGKTYLWARGGPVPGSAGQQHARKWLGRGVPEAAPSPGERSRRAFFCPPEACSLP